MDHKIKPYSFPSLVSLVMYNHDTEALERFQSYSDFYLTKSVSSDVGLLNN